MKARSERGARCTAAFYCMGLWLEGIEAVEGVRLSMAALENVSNTFFF
jgi:hypothetical protein